MEIQEIPGRNNELIHEIEQEFIDVLFYLKKDETQRFKDITLMKISEIKLNNKIIGKALGSSYSQWKKK